MPDSLYHVYDRRGMWDGVIIRGIPYPCYLVVCVQCSSVAMHHVADIYKF